MILQVNHLFNVKFGAEQLAFSNMPGKEHQRTAPETGHILVADIGTDNSLKL
jgi:hypothetical protein